MIYFIIILLTSFIIGVFLYVETKVLKPIYKPLQLQPDRITHRALLDAQVPVPSKDNLFVGDEARQKVINGVLKATNAVKLTLGAKGINGLLEAQDYPYAISTNDGISILESMHFDDPLENMGLNLVKETSGRHNKQSGDGSTTTATLLGAILTEGVKYSDSPIEIKRSLEACLPIIEEALDKQKKSISTSEVGAVASIAAEDEKIGALIQEIYEEIGPDGIVHLDVSKTFDDHYSIGKGVKMSDAGFASPYFADTDDQGNFQKAAKLKNPAILLIAQKITSALELNELITKLYNSEKKELVIFANEVEAPVIPNLILTRAKTGFRTLLVKMPVLWKDYWYSDIAKLTGATVIDEGTVSLKNATLEHLGTCGEVLVDKDATYLDGIKDIMQHLKDLEAEGSDDALLRLSRLNTKTARLFVGAPSDQALSYKRLKIEDARNAAYFALQDGIVAGGGVALVNVVKSLPDTIGGKILRVALKIPAKQIAENAGFPDMVIGEDYENGRGLDAKTGQFVDMFEVGILDPSKIVKGSVKNAVSVASAVLSDKIFVTLPKLPQSINPQMPTV